jgi:hypothetical protein
MDLRQASLASLAAQAQPQQRTKVTESKKKEPFFTNSGNFRTSGSLPNTFFNFQTSFQLCVR